MYSFQCIVCVGGEDDKVVLRSVEAWDPAKDSWRQLSCLPFAVSKHGLVVSGNNMMYMAGGEYPDGSASKSVWRFDPRTNSWQEMAPMNTPRSELGLALLDGFIYAVGGWEGSSRLDTVERFDAESNAWTLLSTPMKMAVTSPAVVALDGALYVCGGAILEDGDGIDLVQKLDINAGTWSESAPMLIPRSGSAACVLNGLIYVIGGWHASTENTNKVERFDPAKNQWQFVCPMHERRYRPGVSVCTALFSVPDQQQRLQEGAATKNHRRNNVDCIYVMGGEEGWDRYHESIERYDPERDRWETVGHMPSARSWLSCVGLKVKAASENGDKTTEGPAPSTAAGVDPGS